jgi:hypothetical protein
MARTTAPAPTLSRDAVLVIERCKEAFGGIPMTIVADLSVLDDSTSLDAARAACDEAYLQTMVDLGESSGLAKAVATVGLRLAELNLAHLNGESLEVGSPAYEAYANGIGPALAAVDQQLASTPTE